jgi:hypothetical protein
MALRSVAHTLISERTGRLRRPPSSASWAFMWAAFLTVAIAGPWLVPGYLFGTDWPGPRRFDLPTVLSSEAPLRVALAVVAAFVGGEFASKVLIFGVLFAAATLSYKALPSGGFVPRAAASTIYVVNPFVYGRLHYGQFLVLGAYALLPWAASRLRLLLNMPGLATSLLAAISFLVLGTFSPHFFLIAGVLATVLLLVYVLSAKEKFRYVKRSAPWLLLAAGVTLVGSTYWIFPIAIGQGPEAAIIGGTGAGHLGAYAAVPDRSLGLVPNLLGLYGFWAENSGRFLSMKAFVPYWPIVLGVLLLTAAVGTVGALRDRTGTLGPWVVGLLAAAALALVLEMGVSHPATAGLVGWLDAHFGAYRGMRDAGKWAALLALAYSQLVGLGAAALLMVLQSRLHDVNGSEWAASLGAALLLALPLYYGNGLLFGSHGEIKPSQYPVGWYEADRTLAADPSPGRTLFLPWHQYMSFSFIHNQNIVVGCPGPTFFSVPILSSTDPEVPGVAPPVSTDQIDLSGLVRAGSTGKWAEVLGARGVKYILVAHELDWSSYMYLDNQAGIVRVGDYGSIVLYRNSLVN